MAPADVYDNLALSPDGRFVAFDRGSPPGIWLVDVDRPVPTRLNSDPTARLPVWSPDGRTIAFTSRRAGAVGLYVQPVGATGGDRLVLQGDLQISPSDWSHDGKYLIYTAGGDLWALPMAGATKPVQLTASPTFQEFEGTLSPTASGSPINPTSPRASLEQVKATSLCSHFLTAASRSRFLSASVSPLCGVATARS